MQDERWEGNIAWGGCIQVAFITSDRVIKVSTPAPAAFYVTLVLPGYLEERGEVKGRTSRCVGESKKQREKEREKNAESCIVRAGM